MACLFILIGCLLEGEFCLLAATFLATTGTWTDAPVAWTICAFVGAFLGDLAGFEFGRRSGGGLLARYPKWQERADRIGAFLARYSLVAVVLLRFQIGCRTLGHYCLGRGQVTRTVYLPLSLAACLAWALAIPPLCRWFWQLTGILGLI